MYLYLLCVIVLFIIAIVADAILYVIAPNDVSIAPDIVKEPLLVFTVTVPVLLLTPYKFNVPIPLIVNAHIPYITPECVTGFA